MLKSALYSVRFFIRTALGMYEWYNPELKFGGCMIEYARSQYPELKGFTFSYENVFTFLKGIYGSFYGHVNEMIDEYRQETINERDRIGSKIVQITAADAPNAIYFNKNLGWNNKFNQPNIDRYERGRSSRRRMDTFSLIDSKAKIQKNSTFTERKLKMIEPKKDDFTVMYVGPRHFLKKRSDTDAPTTTTNMDNDGTSDNEIPDDESIENLFDFENIIMESLGLSTAKSVKRSSFTRCTQSYVIGLLMRTIDGLIRAI